MKLTAAELDSHNAEFHPIEEYPPLTWRTALVAIATVVIAMAASALLPIWRIS